MFSTIENILKLNEHKGLNRFIAQHIHELGNYLKVNFIINNPQINENNIDIIEMDDQKFQYPIEIQKNAADNTHYGEIDTYLRKYPNCKGLIWIAKSFNQEVRSAVSLWPKKVRLIEFELQDNPVRISYTEVFPLTQLIASNITFCKVIWDEIRSKYLHIFQEDRRKNNAVDFHSNNFDYVIHLLPNRDCNDQYSIQFKIRKTQLRQDVNTIKDHMRDSFRAKGISVAEVVGRLTPRDGMFSVTCPDFQRKKFEELTQADQIKLREWMIHVILELYDLEQKWN